MKTALRNREIASLLKPYVLMRTDPILPNINKIISPMKGEKITGKRTGRLATCLMVIKGWNMRPIRVFVKMYVLKIKNVLLFIWIIVFQKFSE